MNWATALSLIRPRLRECLIAASVTADAAFDTRKCYDAIAAHGAAAIILPHKNAKPWKPDTAPGPIARNEALRASRRFGGRFGDDGEGPVRQRFEGSPERYHRRSHVEI